MKLSRLVLFGSFLVYIMRNNSTLMFKPRFYYFWIVAFLLYHLILTFTVAVDISNSFSFLMSTTYTLIINAIMLYYIDNDTEFSFKILKYIPIFALFGGLRLYLTYGFTYYLGTRGTDLNANGPAFTFAIGSLIAIYLILSNKKKSKSRYIYAFLALIDTIFLVLTASRVAIIVVFGVPVIFYLIFKDRNSYKLICNIFLVLGLVFIAFIALMNVPFLYNLVGHRIESMLSGLAGGSTDSSTSTRLRLMQQGLTWFKENPIFGYGLNSFSIMNTGIRNYYAHNNFIEMLVAGGIFGFLIYYSLYAVIFFTGMKRKFRRNLNSLYFMGLFLGFLISEFGRVTYYTVASQLVLMLSYYFCVSIHPLKRQDMDKN